VEVSDTDITDGIHECENSLYGKIFADRDINIKGLKSAMMHAWGCRNLKIIKLGKPFFHFFFENEKDLERLYTMVLGLMKIIFSSSNNGQRI
jgi:hypothetical protein